MDERRGYEALVAGEGGPLGAVTVEQERAVAFAAAYDPQPFHLDAAAGAASPLGGLAASGWYTCSLLMRLMADNLLAGLKSMGSGEVFDLKWLKPVLVGDRLQASYEIMSVRPSSRGDRGYAQVAFAMTNQHGDSVLTLSCTLIVGL